MNSRHLLVVAAAGLSLLAAACGTSAKTSASKSPATTSATTATTSASGASKPASLTVTESGAFLAYSTLDIAKSRGYFAKENLNVKVVNTPGGETAAAALFSGSAQISVDSTEHAMQATETGRPVVSFAAANNQLTVAVVVSNALWKADNLGSATLDQKIKALEGQKLAVLSPAGENVSVFNELFQSVGTTAAKSGTKYITIGNPSAQINALNSGEIAGFNLAAPFPQEVVAKGYGHIIIDLNLGEFTPLNGMISDTYQTTKSYLDSHAAVIQRFTDAVSAAEQWVTANPAAAATELHSSAFSTVSLSLLTAALKELTGSGGISPNPVMTAAGIQENSGFLVASGGKAPSAAIVKEGYTNTFAKASLQPGKTLAGLG